MLNDQAREDHDESEGTDGAEAIVAMACAKALAKKTDLCEAAALLESWARADTELRNALTDRHLYRLAYESIRQNNMDERRNIVRGANRRPGTDDPNRILDHARSLLDMPLFGSARKLRDAYVADLDESIAGYRGQERAAARQGRFFALVKGKMRVAGKTVGESIAEKVLDELWRKAQHDGTKGGK